MALRALAAALSIAMATGATQAATLAEAQAAFDAGQFDRAATIWRELARAGEPEAAFQLGLISDLGIGSAPDRDKAFSRYLEAAQRGHATAQFNVGVMLDAGTGPLENTSAAATWYARAAANGSARAEYNLALLYAEGDGLPQNVGFARAWMTRAAATLPAARTRLEALRALDPGAPDQLVAPLPIAASLVRVPDEGLRLELVWSAGEQPPGTRYRVELDDGGSGGSATGDTDLIEVSAITIPLPSGELPRWRVLAVDGERSAASGWESLSDAANELLSDSRDGLD